MAELSERLAPLDLRPAEVACLMLIETNPGTTQSELGRTLGVQRANMVPLIAALEQRTLILRKPVDGRSHAVWLTPTGGTILAKAHKIVACHEAELMARVPAKIRSMVLPVLMALWSRPDQ
jgi:DNA-binding MarR family transcriptional regulator